MVLYQHQLILKKEMHSKGTLILIPTSGLGNRLRIITASIKLARESDKKLVIYWYKNYELYANHDELFDFHTDITIKEIPLKYKIWMFMRRVSSKILGLDKYYLRFFKFDFTFFDGMACLIWQNKMNIQNEIDKAKNVFICSCQELNYFDLKDYQLFKPKSGIQKKIDQLTLNFNPGVIGIHIRSTDNIDSIINSPFELFIKKIEDELKDNPEATFFLATDNENYQSTLIEKFGSDKIISQVKEFRRDVSNGIKDAVVDLFCLSKTSKIYGSYFSSFSYVAGRIGNVQVEVLKIEE